MQLYRYIFSSGKIFEDKLSLDSLICCGRPGYISFIAQISMERNIEWLAKVISNFSYYSPLSGSLVKSFKPRRLSIRVLAIAMTFPLRLSSIKSKDFFLPFGGQLSGNNDAAQFFKGFGAPATPYRRALGIQTSAPFDPSMMVYFHKWTSRAAVS